MSTPKRYPVRGFEGEYDLTRSGRMFRKSRSESDGRKREREIHPRSVRGDLYFFIHGEDGPVRRHAAELILETLTPRPENCRVGYRDGNPLNIDPQNIYWMPIPDYIRLLRTVESLPGEEWRSVVGWEGLYEVSSLGRVRSVPRIDRKGRRVQDRIMKPSRGNSGYQQVGLKSIDRDHSQTKMVHRLVGDAFLGVKPGGLVTRHLDGDKSNNAAVNLAYGTYRENSLDILRHGRHPSQKTNLCPRGHLREGPNAVPSGQKPHVKSCRACGNAASWVRIHPEDDLKWASDQYYEQIMSGTPRIAIPAPRLAKLKNLMEDGVSLNEIERTLGCSPKTVRKHFPDYRPFPPGGGGEAAEIKKANAMLRRIDDNGRLRSRRNNY